MLCCCFEAIAQNDQAKEDSLSFSGRHSSSAPHTFSLSLSFSLPEARTQLCHFLGHPPNPPSTLQHHAKRTGKIVTSIRTKRNEETEPDAVHNIIVILKRISYYWRYFSCHVFVFAISFRSLRLRPKHSWWNVYGWSRRVPTDTGSLRSVCESVKSNKKSHKAIFAGVKM